MESEGLLTHRRDPDNRRVHMVELTARGEAAFHRMRGAAADFDRRLRAGLSESDVTRLAELLDQLRANVAGTLERESKRR
jgi:MarR family transcriptional regulator for hemolysin